MEYTTDRLAPAGVPHTARESHATAVSWAAILAGAVVTAALALILLTAGTGLGFASMSPWNDAGASAATLAISAIVWLLATQIISSGLGGYIAGRLRTKWVETHSDEVYFRDTAHGLLVWAVGAVISVVMLGSAASSLLGGTAKVGATALAGAGAAATQMASGAAARGGNSADYFVDTLFRSDRPDATGDRTQARTEVGRILATSLANGAIAPEDKAYVARVVAAQAGIDEAAAQKRVDDMVNKAQAAADQAKQKALEVANTARKAAAGFALWAFVSLLVGAFSASFAATVGGRARDRIVR